MKSLDKASLFTFGVTGSERSGSGKDGSERCGSDSEAPGSDSEAPA